MGYCCFQTSLMLGGVILYSMRQSTKKALNFANEIRRNQRNQIISGLRSKLLGHLQLNSKTEMEEDEPTPTTILSQHITHDHPVELTQVLAVLASIKQQQQLQAQKGTYPYGCDLLQYIITRKDEESFQFQSSQCHPRREMTVGELKAGLLQLPKLITRLNTQININLARIKSVPPEALRDGYNVLKKISQCEQVRSVVVLLGDYLNAYSQVVGRGGLEGRVNYELMEAVTDCLIESTCFKARRLQEGDLFSQELQLLGVAINSEMDGMSEAVNGELCLRVMACIAHFQEQREPLKLFTNYIYLIGNVFISIHSHLRHQPHLQSYDHLHALILEKFNAILLQVETHLANTDNITAEGELLELGSLMMWFIRNEFLNRRGVFQGENLTTSIDSTVASHWLRIIFTIFTILRRVLFLKYQSVINPVIDREESSLLQEGVAMVQLIYFDFPVSHTALQEAFQHISAFRELLTLEAEHHQPLRSKILDFYMAVAREVENQEWMKRIAVEAECVLNYGPSYPSALRFAVRLLQPESRLLAKYKAAIFDKICCLIDAYIVAAKTNPKEAVISSVLFLILSAAKAQQYLQMVSGKAFPLLNEQRVTCILQICGLLWEQSPKVEALVDSLELVKVMAEVEGLREGIGEVMKRKGYDRQLEEVSMNPSEQVNRLVYEITEILQIESQ